jgi:hypothetical protein
VCRLYDERLESEVWRLKDFELRKTKAFCRLCECTSEDEMVVIPFRYSGKSAPIILCKGCVKHLNEAVFNDAAK